MASFARINKGGRINRHGKWVGGRWGLVDHSGKVILTPEFSQIKNFNENTIDFAWINHGGNWSYNRYDHPILNGGKWGLIDLSGKIVLQPQFDRVEYFSKSLKPLAKVAVGGKWSYEKYIEAKWGVVDNAGNILISPMFDQIRDFDEHGFAIINVGGIWEKKPKTTHSMFEPHDGKIL